ncbi:hypothetical protein NDU88_003033 [Pleurodeles waltl]|uniref:CCHC-type domain-containing protein n=1 Tax=Pleurodeles waltl TaxID=8319 RepID=A0AAV7RH34_PLEWA|nr:hypothetical protein NDU88_003033 [Pleurodeles waltl]
MNRGTDLGTVGVQNDVQGMKKLLPCHSCGAIGHWKWECPMMVQEGVVQQSNDINSFQNMRGPRVPFLQEKEAGDGYVAAGDPVDIENEEAEDEDGDNRSAIIHQYFQ